MDSNMCQFYIVIGDKGFVSPDNVNVYINATDVTDLKVIQDEIFRLYKEKAKAGFKVSGEIIFLVGGISDSDKANEIIRRLRLNGRIEVIKSSEVNLEKIEKIPEENIKVLEEKKIEDNKISEKEKEVVPVKEVKEMVLDEEITDIKPDNVYKREFESNYNGYIGKPIEKKDKFGKLPVIFFIVSLILFIGSIVLLFVF